MMRANGTVTARPDEMVIEFLAFYQGLFGIHISTLEVEDSVFEFGLRVPVNSLVDLEREATDVEIRQICLILDKRRHGVRVTILFYFFKKS